MEGTLRDLLKIRANNLGETNTHRAVHGFNCIGVAESVPDLGTETNGVSIWHVPDGILPLTHAELTRWSLDVPDGFHWVLSERSTDTTIFETDSMKIVIWPPDHVSKWVGDAILSGELVATAPVLEENEEFPRNPDPGKKLGNTSLRSLIDASSWMSKRGIEGVGSSPVSLKARLWTVEGVLKGPNGELESGTWSLVEDPWSQSLAVIDPSTLLNSPDLRSLEPKPPSWLSEERISEEVVKLLEVRRKGNFESSGNSGTVRSTLLQRWIFDAAGSIMSFVEIQIPGWIIHFEDEKILHGRNGRLY